MSTGEKASLNEVLASVGKNSFKSAVHTAISSNLKNIIGDIKDRDKDSSEGAYFPQGKNFETYNQASISYFDDLLANDKVTCLIGDNNSLYTVIVLKTPNELEDITMLVNIK